LGRTYALTTIGTFALIFLAAFESLAVTTVMPGISRDLDGAQLFALSFAAPLASSIVGMVVAGMWSDRSGPGRPLWVAVSVFALGMVICGLAPTMEVLVAGRLVQGLGGGASIVAIYVLVGEVYPAALQPRVFASFAAAWVLPALVGPSVAALIADQFGWQWVFLTAVFLAAVSLALCVPALRQVPPRARDADAVIAWSRCWWAALAAVGVLVLDVFGNRGGWGYAAAAAAVAVILVAARPLLPVGTLRAVRGLPSTILTRGALAAGFFSVEAYVPFVLQDHWGYSPAHAGIALTLVGVSWAIGSQLQGRMGAFLTHRAATCWGVAIVVVGISCCVLAVYAGSSELSDWMLIGAYVVGGFGMGISYPRTSVAMLEASTNADRGFNSSALSIADSLAAAVALTVAGLAFTFTQRHGSGSGVGDPFVAELLVALLFAIGAMAAAVRTR
jgi:MFS family permease